MGKNEWKERTKQSGQRRNQREKVKKGKIRGEN